MYHHSNQSATSTGSSRRISTNNPFRSALLQEERSAPSNIDETQYNSWLSQRIEEEKHDAKRSSYNSYGDDDYYDDDDANSFTEGDEFDFAKPGSVPINTRSMSDNSARRSRDSYNPFATYTRSRSNTPVHTPSRSTFSRHSGSSPVPVGNEAPLPPPSYEEVVGTKYAKDEYPKDEKNPFPERANNNNTENIKSSEAEYGHNNGNLRRANTTAYQSRRPAPPPPPPIPSSHTKPQLNPESMTSTTTTRILSDGRVRSKSTGDQINERAHSSRHKHSSKTDEQGRHHHGSRSHHHSHRSHDRDRRRDQGYDDDDEGYERQRRSNTRRKKFVQERSKNLDTIDKLDVTGFFGGGKFHHDGPFDACTPQRNKDTKAAPVAAFPVDGPNNSIKGMAPENSKDQQYDMVFGIDNARGDIQAPAKPRSNSDIKRGYTNGTVVKRANTSDLESLVSPDKNVLAQVDASQTEKLYGDTTLGLGASTFMDGAPAYGAKQTNSKDGGLGRKKTFLGRMKTIVRK